MQKLTISILQLDAEDESLARWKASLGIGAGGASAAPSGASFPLARPSRYSRPPAAAGPSVQVLSLSLHSPSRPTPIELDLTQADKLKSLKKERESILILSFCLGREVDRKSPRPQP